MKITTATSSASDVLTTGNGKITVNPQCQSHKFSLSPDYEAHYRVGNAGTYNMSLTAQTKNGTESISDQLVVQNSVPFDVQRVSATRIYPPNNYPVQLNVTANQDFDGKVTETVPESFTITASDTTNSYDSMQTLYMNPAANPVRSLDKEVLGASTSALFLPFTGEYPVTQGFGIQQTDPILRNLYLRFGIAGHDGADFGLPMGTPVRAVDDGTVLLAGNGDYGITVIIQHAWGKSYYGHLSEVAIGRNQQVTKGQQIGLSGETGEATGPHLHFGMKPNGPDVNNGYFGKVDPLPYFNLPPSATMADGTTSLIPASDVLGASTSAQQENDPVTAPQEITESVQEVNDHLVNQKLQSEILDAKTTENADKVKVITWNVSLKQGQSVSLGYTFKAPSISPQFYLLGPLRFYENNTPGSAQGTATAPVFAETRQWQIAADQVGDAWYNDGTKYGGYAWQYRKQITIDHTKVVPTYPDVTFMESGTDATQDFSFYNTTFSGGAGAAVTSDATLANTGPRSIKSTGNSPNFSDVTTAAGSLNGTAGRISFYVRFATFINSDIIEQYNGATFVGTPLTMNSSHVLCDGNTGGGCGSTVLSTGVWYHISLAYSITSTTVNQFKIYLNGNLEHSDTNVTTNSTSPDRMRMGDFDSTDVNTQINMDDIYADNGADLSDPGPVRVTAKLPITNGTTNNMTTNGTPTGDTVCTIGTHCEWVNELPLNTVEFLSGFSSAVENFGIQGASAGDVDISSATLIADEAWIDAQRAGTCGTAATITNNGANTPITLTTSYAMYTSIAQTYSYPSNSATVGIVGCSSSSKATDLAEAGMLFAYTPTTPNQTLSNFPVLVSLASDNDLHVNAQSSGNDILFTDQTGTKLDFEIEKYTSATGELEAWVRIPTLSSSADTIIYMYYGNAAAANQQNVNATWNSNYIAVYHLAETSGNQNDSTTNGLNFTTVTAQTEGSATGQIDGADQFTSTGNTNTAHTSGDNSLFKPANISLEAWVYLTAYASGGTTIARKEHTVSPFFAYQVGVNTSHKAQFLWVNTTPTTYTVNGNTTINLNTWYHLVGMYDGTHLKIYVNGVDDSSSTVTPTGTNFNSDSFASLTAISGTNDVDGTVDEVRYNSQTGGLSAGWIATEYNNQHSPSTFYTLGSTDDVPSGSTVETKAYAPQNDQLMRGGKWFCPQATASAYPGDTTCPNGPGGIQPYVF